MDLSKRKVAQYMERRFTKIELDQTVAHALQMIDNDPNGLGVVVDSNALLKGIIGISDIAQRPNEMSSKLEDTSLFTDSTNVVTSSPDDTLDKTLDLMDSHNVKSAVVVENNRPIGLVTRRGLRQKLIREFRIQL